MEKLSTHEKKMLKEWIRALRSGKYNQNKYYLHDYDYENGYEGYCCLGVGCDLFIDAYWESSGNIWTIKGCDSRPPVGDTTFQKFVDRTNNFSNECVGDRLADLNDDGVGFEEIANLLQDCLDTESISPLWD